MLSVSYLYDLPLPSPRAATIQILNTCRALVDLGARATVYAGPVHRHECARFYGIDPHEGFRLVPLFSRIPGRPELGWRLRRILREAAGASRHVVMSRGEPGAAVLPRLRRLRPPPSTLLVYEAHRLAFAREAERLSGRCWQPSDPLPPPAAGIRERERQAIESADAIVALTPGVRRAIEREFKPACPSLVLPSGVSVPRAAAGEGPRDIDVIYAGKLEDRKGLAVLLEAMRHLPGRRLIVLGGSDAEVATQRRLSNELGVAGRVTFTGFVPPSSVPSFLRRARAGVCPLPTGVSAISDEFTSPLKLLELMAHRVPAVASDVEPVRAIAEHRRSAMLVSPDDPRALAAGIETVLGDPDLAGRLTAAAAHRALEFSWEARARQLMAFLEEL